VTAESWEWPVRLDEDDRRQFFRDLRDAASEAEAACDAAPVDRCLREWRATAEALSDPERRAALTSPHDPADFTEVQQPGGDNA
jgi:hypothetical protein